MKYILLSLILAVGCQQKETVDTVDNSAYDALDKSFLSLADFEGLTDETTRTYQSYDTAALYALRSALSPRMAVNHETTTSDTEVATTVEWDESCKNAPPTLDDLSLQLISRSRWIALDHRIVENCAATIKMDGTELGKVSYQNANYQVLISQFCEAGDYTSFLGQKFSDVEKPFFTCTISDSSVQTRLKASFEATIEIDGEPTSHLKLSQSSLMSDPDGNDCAYSVEDGGLRVKNCVFADHFDIESESDSYSNRTAEKIIWKYTDVLTNPDMEVIEGKIELMSYRGWTGQVMVWKDDPVVSYKLTGALGTLYGEMDFGSSLKSWVHKNLLQKILEQALP